MSKKQHIDTKDKSDKGAFIQIAPFRTYIRKTEPHKHNNYFELILLSKGSGRHTIDYRTYEVKPPVLFFIRKEQVHYWDLSTEPKGYVVLLKRDFFDESSDHQLGLLLSELSTRSCIQLDEGSSIEEMLALLLEEHQQEGRYSKSITEGLLKALFAKISTYPVTESTNLTAKHDTFRAFLELLSDTGNIRNQVAYYAAQLNTSPQNLNAICRKQSGQSASETIATFIISEVKRLLEYTSMPVAQIAYQLEFKDPSHFVKFFKRHTGHTPQAFREMGDEYHRNFK
jgi:AraC-like DNA-binding protein